MKRRRGMARKGVTPPTRRAKGQQQSTTSPTTSFVDHDTRIEAFEIAVGTKFLRRLGWLGEQLQSGGILGLSPVVRPQLVAVIEAEPRLALWLGDHTRGARARLSVVRAVRAAAQLVPMPPWLVFADHRQYVAYLSAGTSTRPAIGGSVRNVDRRSVLAAPESPPFGVTVPAKLRPTPRKPEVPPDPVQSERPITVVSSTNNDHSSPPRAAPVSLDASRQTPASGTAPKPMKKHYQNTVKSSEPTPASPVKALPTLDRHKLRLSYRPAPPADSNTKTPGLRDGEWATGKCRICGGRAIPGDTVCFSCGG